MHRRGAIHTQRNLSPGSTLLVLMTMVLVPLDVGLAEARPTGNQGMLWKAGVNLGPAAGLCSCLSLFPPHPSI